MHEVMKKLGHASAEAVCAELRENGAKITTASVYNTLALLADKRIYGRRFSATNKMFFDVNTDRHIHLYDRENHTFRDLYDEDLQNLVTTHLKRRKFKGYTIEDIDIQIVVRPTAKNRNI